MRKIPEENQASDCWVSSHTETATSGGHSRRGCPKCLWALGPFASGSSENCDNTPQAQRGDVYERMFLVLKPEGLQLLLCV